MNTEARVDAPLVVFADAGHGSLFAMLWASASGARAEPENAIDRPRDHQLHVGLMAAFRIRLAHLLNGWLAASASQPAPSYTKRPDGTVRLSGNIRSGDVGAAAFELPPDCRPVEAMQLLVASLGPGGRRRAGLAL